MALPIDQVPIGEGRQPDGQSGGVFYISKVALEAVEKDGPDWKWDDSRFIFEAIRDPDAIFRGLNRPGEEDAVRPTHDPNSPESEVLPRYGQAFLVFVRLGVFGYVVVDWDWRKEDPELPGHPLNWITDFVERTWHKT